MENNTPPPEKEKIERYQEEIKKYLDEEKKKKSYGLYLTEEDVEIVKKSIKVPLSKVVDDFIRMMSISIQKIKEQKKKEGENEENKNN